MEKPGSCLSGFSARSFGKLRGFWHFHYPTPCGFAPAKREFVSSLPTGHGCPEGWTFRSIPPARCRSRRDIQLPAAACRVAVQKDERMAVSQPSLRFQHQQIAPDDVISGPAKSPSSPPSPCRTGIAGTSEAKFRFVPDPWQCFTAAIAREDAGIAIGTSASPLLHTLRLYYR